MFSIDPHLQVLSVRSYEPNHRGVPDVAGDSSYVERVCASTLGPTGLLAYRRLLCLVADRDERFVLDIDDLGASLGVPRKIVLRSIERIVSFRFAHVECGELLVHTRIPLVHGKRLERLGSLARADHLEYLGQLIAAGNDCTDTR